MVRGAPYRREPLVISGDDESLDPFNIQTQQAKRWAFSPKMAQEILDKVAMGRSLTKILDGVTFPPYNEFRRWCRENPKLEEELHKAREDRTEWLRDRLCDMIDLVDEDNTAEIKQKADIIKFLLGAEHKKQYGQTKVEVGVSQPVQIIVQTGIDRTPIKEVAPAQKTDTLGEGEGYVQIEDASTSARDSREGTGVSDCEQGDAGQVLPNTGILPE